MSDSVGQISLDLGLNDVTEKQIENISEKIKSNITKALSNLGDIGNVNKTLDSIQNTIKKMIDSIHSEIKSNLSELKSYIEDIFSKLKVKNPMENFLNKDSAATNENDASTKTSRGPPIGVKVPKVDLSSDTEYIKSQIENLTAQLDQVGAKADEERYKIKDLRKEIENLSKPTGNKAMDFINQEQIKKLQIELSKAEQRLNKFASTSDKTAFTIIELEKKLGGLGNATNTSSKGVKGLFSKLGALGSAAKKVSSASNATAENIKRSARASIQAGGHFKKLGNIGSDTGRRFHGMGNMISRSFGRVLRQVLVIRIMYRALRGLISYTGSALMTNRQFAHSLNQIRTNLMVAFMPIYQAVLPALNALMSALSTVTAYIATFISAIFGKTYKQSFNAAKGLNKARAAMGAYGKSTKKAGADSKKAAKDMEAMKGALMGFDEINQLDLDKDKGKKDKGDSGGDGMPPMVMPDVDVSPASAAGKAIEGMAKKVKAVLATIFQPFKNAWAKEGQATIASIKYALHSILDLLGSIGNSMLTVWSNGTGEAILTVILQILQDIFNIIGDISSTFTTAWNKGGIGTSIVQGIANTILNLLTLVKKVGDSFREVWGQIGTPLADTFMQVVKSTIDTLENLSQKLIYVWDNGGEHLFQGLIRLGSKIFELAGYIYTQFVLPFVDWFVNNMAPAIAPVLDFIGKLLDKFTELIDWLMNDGKPVLDIIVTVLGSMAAAFGVVKGAIALYHGVIKIATGVSKVFGAAIAWLTSPIGIAIVAIGAIIAIGVLLYKNWDTLKAKAAKVWGNIKSTFECFKNWLGNVFATDWSRRFGFFGDILNAFLHTVKDIWNSIKRVFSGIIDFVAGVFTGNWRRAWQGVVNIFGGIFDGIKALAKAPLNGVISLINGAIGGLNKISLPDWVPGIGGKGINIPKIPMLARGGIIDQPTLSMVGEAGKEAVVPLENNTGWIDKISEVVANAIVAAMQFNGSKTNNQDNSDIVMQLDGVTFARLIKKYIDSENQRIGNDVILKMT
ncbi:phage tail protein [Haloimpatiens massiliensis]|uniref:phage tail protein n=1 Tax=Haloimpatiens massiliensis TaxID=1658110 RepID=UPI000C861492|nr:hypothetical protein [Haloimpatiens massiliensis]